MKLQRHGSGHVDDQLDQVRQVLNSIVGADRMQQVGDDDPIFEQQVMDSVHLVEFVERIEEKFGFEVSGSELNPTNFHSVRAVARFVGARMGST